MKSKTILLLIVWFLYANQSSAQDLIVFKSNDSINCKILKDNNEKTIEIAINNKNNIEISSVNTSDILSIRKNYFVTSKNAQTPCFDSIFTKQGELILGKIIEDKSNWYIKYELPNLSKQNIPYSSVKNVVKCPNDSANNFGKSLPIKKLPSNNNIAIQQVFKNKKYRLALDGIFAFRPSINPNNNIKSLRNHFNQLRYNAGLALTFHIAINKRRNFLVGVQLMNLNASANSTNVQYPTNAGVTYTGDLTSLAVINSFGPNILVKLGKGKSLHSCALQFGLNFVFYNESLRIDNYNLTKYGTTLAQGIHVLYDYKMSKSLSFGSNLGLEGGTLNTISVIENGKQSTQKLSKTQIIGLSRLSIEAGIRYWF